MNTQPSIAAPETATSGDETILCYFYSPTHHKAFQAGQPALTLCGAWVDPSKDTATDSTFQAATGKTIYCPRCMNIRHLAN